MNEREAWEFIAERISASQGICYWTRCLYTFGRISEEVHSKMLGRVINYRWSKHIASTYIWPLNEDGRVARIDFCLQQAEAACS